MSLYVVVFIDFIVSFIHSLLIVIRLLLVCCR